MSLDLYREGDGAHFVLQGSLAGLAAGILLRKRMASEVRPLPWPSPGDYGLDDKDPVTVAVLAAVLGGEELPEGTDPELAGKAEKFDRRLHHCMESERPSWVGIPAYKLRSSDGWLVTPNELAAAFRIYDDTLKTRLERDGMDERDVTLYTLRDIGGERLVEPVVEFLAFLRSCKDTGFRVW